MGSTDAPRLFGGAIGCHAKFVIERHGDFLIKLESGEYLTKCRMTSNYFDYERTIHKAVADRLNDFDSRLVLKKLANLDEKNATPEEILGE